MDGLWTHVEELIDRAPSWRALRAHRLHLLAARLWRSRGRPLPEDVDADRRRAALSAIAVPVLLRRARAAYDGELMLMKGPEAAARYPDPLDRYFHDLDLLADDAPAAQRALTAAGFVEFGDPAAYDAAQHLCPLMWPGLPLIIELHRYPSSPGWLTRPGAAAVLSRGVPSATGVAGLLAPDPAAHALLLAAHSWSGQPMGRLVDLLDVAAVLGDGHRAAANELARDWRWEPLWQTMIDAADSLWTGTPPPLSLRIWARHLRSARDFSVWEDHFSRIAARAWSVPTRRVPTAVTSGLMASASRRADERWYQKLRRSRLALTHAFMEQSVHEQSLSTGRSQ